MYIVYSALQNRNRLEIMVAISQGLALVQAMFHHVQCGIKSQDKSITGHLIKGHF